LAKVNIKKKIIVVLVCEAPEAAKLLIPLLCFHSIYVLAGAICQSDKE
jgi:hypothetical protein